jgi:hypothetical protein
MRPYLLELLLVSADAIGKVDGRGSFARCEASRQSIALATALVLIVVLAEADHASPQVRRSPVT